MTDSLTIHSLLCYTRNGEGGTPAQVVIEPSSQWISQREALARELPGVTAFVGLDTPHPLPVAFFDAKGPRPDGEEAAIAVFRALGLSGRTVARRVLLDTVEGELPVQEEVFRRPTNAQVWVEVALNETSSVSPALQKTLLEALELDGPLTCAQVGSTLVLSDGSLEALRAARFNLEPLRSMIPLEIADIILHSRTSPAMLSDGYLRHVCLGGSQRLAREQAASIKAVGALGQALWAQGQRQTYYSFDQGFDLHQRCRISLWLDGETGSLTRISVGGQVHRLSVSTRTFPESP
jgi:hypothetical protein